MEEVTIKKLHSFDDVNAAIDWARKQYGEFPQRPSKPFLSRDHNSEDAFVHAKALGIWEDDMKIYDAHKKEYQSNVNKINTVVEEFIKAEANLEDVPEKYRQKVYALASEKGHSYGYYSIYQELLNLVDIFQ